MLDSLFKFILSHFYLRNIHSTVRFLWRFCLVSCLIMNPNACFKILPFVIFLVKFSGIIFQEECSKNSKSFYKLNITIHPKRLPILISNRVVLNKQEKYFFYPDYKKDIILNLGWNIAKMSVYYYITKHS